jgi:hypothetical protein
MPSAGLARGRQNRELRRSQLGAVAAEIEFRHLVGPGLIHADLAFAEEHILRLEFELGRIASGQLNVGHHLDFFAAPAVVDRSLLNFVDFVDDLFVDVPLELRVKTQIWIAVSVYVLVAIVRKRLGLEASLYETLQILSVTLFEKTHFMRSSGPRCECRFRRKPQPVDSLQPLAGQ